MIVDFHKAICVVQRESVCSETDNEWATYSHNSPVLQGPASDQIQSPPHLMMECAGHVQLFTVMDWKENTLSVMSNQGN